MKKRVSAWILASTLGLTAVCTHAGPIELKEYAFNVDGVFTPASAPAGVDLSAFEMTSGMGIIMTTITGAGGHFFGGWFDHEINQAVSTPFNEWGAPNGTTAYGQSWEIDEPGSGSDRDGTAGVQYFGDIYSNIEDSTPGMVYLDNQVFYDGFDGQNLSPFDDVSMAMGWDFTLGLDERASIELLLSDIQPLSGFYLTQWDEVSSRQVFFSGSLAISAIPVQAPEPSNILLFGVGLLGLGGLCRRRRTA